MNSGLQMLIRWLSVASLLAAGGCGTEAEPRLRVEVRGVDEQSLLEEGESDLYSVLMRFGSVTVVTDVDEYTADEPINADLFAETILFEDLVSGTRVEEVRLELPAPEAAGVVSGEAVSVYVAGLIEESRFVYADAEMDAISVSPGTALSGEAVEIMISFDVDRWFEEIEYDDLAALQSPPFRIDLEATPLLAPLVEAAIRDSAHTEALADDDHPEFEEES